MTTDIGSNADTGAIDEPVVVRLAADKAAAVAKVDVDANGKLVGAQSDAPFRPLTGRDSE